MKCDGLPDPVCVRELNTYLSLWKEDRSEEIDEVLQKTLEVLPIMSTLETLIENPDEWEVPVTGERQTRQIEKKTHVLHVTQNLRKTDVLQKLQVKDFRTSQDLLRDEAAPADEA